MHSKHHKHRQHLRAKHMSSLCSIIHTTVLLLYIRRPWMANKNRKHKMKETQNESIVRLLGGICQAVSCQYYPKPSGGLGGPAVPGHQLPFHHETDPHHHHPPTVC